MKLIKKISSIRGFVRQNFAKQKSDGFTIMELMVTTGIFIVITSIALANYPQFSGRLALGRIAREIALTIRQAQVYGLAVREFPSGSGDYPPYAVYFHKTHNKDFLFFADIIPPGTSPVNSGNRRYDGDFDCPASSECLEEFTLRGSEEIRDVCVIRQDGSELCSPTGPEEIAIVFRRPDPEAIITNNIAEGTAGFERYTAARIILGSERFPGEEKIVRVWLTGQISIE